MRAQGYIYVEGDREAHVKEAVSGLRAVFQSKPARLVPLREMVDALTTSKKGDPLLSAPRWLRCAVQRATQRHG